MDGVLIDSASCHRAAFEEVFLPFGIAAFEYEKYAGWRTAEVVQHVLAAVPDLSPESIDQIASRKSKLARERMLADNPVMPGCVAVLEQLAESYLLALASSGSRESVELFLDTNRCRHLFHSVLCGDEVHRAKPDPEIYLRTFAGLRIPPARAVVVEDAVSGVRAARAAGAGGVVGVAGTVAAEALFEAGAEHVVNAIAELPHLLSDVYEPARAH